MENYPESNNKINKELNKKQNRMSSRSQGEKTGLGSMAFHVGINIVKKAKANRTGLI